MRWLVLAVSLVLSPVPAFALCECACVGGQMRPICSANDIVQPICQGLCLDTPQQRQLVAPLAGSGLGAPEAAASGLSQNQGLQSLQGLLPPQR